MSDNEDLVEYRGSFTGLTGDEAQQIPSSIKCTGCKKVLVSVRRDYKKRRLKMEILTTILPEFSHPTERLGVLTCDKCGAKTNFDLLLFGMR